MHERISAQYRSIRINSDSRPRFLTFSVDDQILFTKRLAVYLSSGIPILEALNLLCEDTRGGSQYILNELVQVVSEGHTLSSGLRSFPRHISAFSASLVEVGERSGTLHQSLFYLSIALRKEQTLKRKLMGALIYPAVIIVVTFGICLFLVLYAFPKIVPLFRGFDATLPFTTRALIFISDSISFYGLYALLAFVILCGSFGFLLQKPRIRSAFDRKLLQAPVFGSLMRNYCLARLSRTLSALLSSGISIVPALELASSIAGSRAYLESLAEARERVLSGDRISNALHSSPVCFPSMYVQMVSTGENTGSLSMTLSVLAEHYEEEFDSESASLSALIEPLLMIVMGLVVGFIALAIITPVYQITQDMHG